MTTAGGDGLSFIVGQPNVFELIEALQEGRNLLEDAKDTKKQPTDENQDSIITTEDDLDEEEEETPPASKLPYNDYDLLSLEELPSELRPISGLIEMVQHMEQMKQMWRPQSLAEDEFLRIIRQIKSSDKIYSCSHTLQLLVDKYRTLHSEHEALK